MAIAFDAAAASSATTGTSVTYSHTCSGSNLILFVGVNVFNPGTDDVTGVTYGGVAMTQITKVTNALGAGQTNYLYYLVSPKTGANNVIASKSVSATFRCCSASYTLAAQSGVADASGTNTSATSSISKALTTVADNCWMVSFVFNDANVNNAGSGTTKRTDNTYSAIGDSNGAITPAASYSMAWSSTGACNWVLVQASFAPSALSSTNYLKRGRSRLSLSAVSLG